MNAALYIQNIQVEMLLQLDYASLVLFKPLRKFTGFRSAAGLASVDAAKNMRWQKLNTIHAFPPTWGTRVFFTIETLW